MPLKPFSYISASAPIPSYQAQMDTLPKNLAYSEETFNGRNVRSWLAVDNDR